MVELEKEAEESFEKVAYIGDTKLPNGINRVSYIKGFQDGYNKANEWHYHGIPHDYNKPCLCKVVHPTNYDMADLEILFYDEKDMIWFRWLTLWNGEEGNETARINRKVIAWKEIVPPELPKE